MARANRGGSQSGRLALVPLLASYWPCVRDSGTATAPDCLQITIPQDTIFAHRPQREQAAKNAG